MRLRLTLGVTLLSATAALGASAAARDEASSAFWRRSDPADESAVAADEDLGHDSFIVEYARDESSFLREAVDGADLEVIKTYDTPIFKGACVKATGEDAANLLELSTVRRVWPNRKVSMPRVQFRANFSNEAASANYSVHGMTGVDKLHERGILGKGVKIGVVDSGIDYNHPALGGGFGKCHKVRGGRDLVGDGKWPDGEKQPDDDPMDKMGHGTHVAGIIAGEATMFTGVAPRATLYAYKVFAEGSGTDEATLIEAFLSAYEDGVDIITASIGATGGWADDAWAEVASRLVEEGVIVTIAAGNEGVAGPFLSSNGAAGKELLSVASVRSHVSPRSSFVARFTDTDGVTTSSKIGYLVSYGWFDESVKEWPVKAMTLDTGVTNDACEPYTDGPDLSRVVVLVRRGGCSILTKQANLNELGARFILFYNNDDPLTIFETDDYRSKIALIEKHSGEAMVNAIIAGQNVTADFSHGPLEVVGMPTDTGGVPSYFTSWGGLYDLQLKPDIAAPGEDIFSTYTDQWFGSYYTVASGTSMACPYVAGVAALYLSAHGGRETHGKGIAKDLTRRIIASGQSLPWFSHNNTIASPTQVGGGIIDAGKVVDYDTTLSIAKMALNDTANFVGTHEFSVTNNGKSAVVYSFKHEPATGYDIMGVDERGDYMAREVDFLEPVEYEVDVDLPAPVTVQPGASAKVTVKFRNPESKGWNTHDLPLYSGKILVVGDNKESVAVPYMGVAASLRKELDNPFIEGEAANPTLRTYNTPGQGAIYVDERPYWGYDVRGWNMDWPELTLRLKWGTRELRWDIYEPGYDESQWEYPPVVGSKGYIGSATAWARSGWFFNNLSDDPTDVVELPWTQLWRNSFWAVNRHSVYWFGQLANGTEIEPGNYTMRIAVLKPYGSPEKADDWAVMKTPEVSIQGKVSENIGTP